MRVEGLWVDTPSGNAILEDVSFSLRQGETLGLVGESGSGKTTLALSLLHYTQGGARFRSGTISIAGRTHSAGAKDAARDARGKIISYVPQNPGTALNPSTRVGDAIDETLAAHRPDLNTAETRRTALEEVGLAGDRDMLRRFPHQLSGGQQQRVCIALSLVCRPPVVVLDEPTTGLDVVTQEGILAGLNRLRDDRGIAMVYVSHDLAVVGQVADRIAVMYAGRIIEIGRTEQILTEPKHPYTRGLLTSIPDHLHPRRLEAMPGITVGVGERPNGCRFAPRCSLHTPACDREVPELRPWNEQQAARCIRMHDVHPFSVSDGEAWSGCSDELRDVLTVTGLRAVHKTRSGRVTAAEDVDIRIAAGRCVALVGESGSGKTTIARAIAGLHPNVEKGELLLDGATLSVQARRRSRDQRRRVQIVFQNPSDALNPRQRVGASIARPAIVLRRLSKADADQEVNRLLELVRLPLNVKNRYPAELSGGERQRVGIARALAADPDVMICDEITSALDVSVQAAVLELLRDLIDRLGLAVLFITHDLGVVATIAHEVLVLSKGYVCESGPTKEVLRHPRDAYTQRLLTAAPALTTVVGSFQRHHQDSIRSVRPVVSP